MRCFEVQGKSRSVAVRDISEGGAMIDESMPDAAINSPVVLSIEGIALKLKGIVARKDPDATMLTFDLSEDEVKVIRGLVAKRAAA
jgi:hypothetical protein